VPSSLQGNFDAALAKGASYDNVMISTASGSPGNANADGIGNALDEAELKSAGWASGGMVTIDGATFTLPQFGTSSDTADNLLADGQTLGAGGGGIQGSALVFLATSTNGFVQVPGAVGTGSPDAGALQHDPTAPYTPSGYGITGSGCSAVLAINTTATCTPAIGQINYATGCATGNQGSYTLAVPDWVSGPLDISSLQTASRDHPGGQQADTPSVYAFAVPLDPSCTVTSVQLPDVGDSVSAQLTSGLTASQPALHILGMAVRNTTTATPAVGTYVGGTGSQTSPESPSGQAWTGAWESPIEDAFSPPSGDTWGDQTVRIAFAPNTQVPAGTDVRIRLSNPGFLSGDGDGPLTIGAATLGSQASSGGPVLDASPQQLTFGGSDSVTIPVGGDVYSDPLSLSDVITEGGVLSVELTNSKLSVLPLNSFPSAGRAWFAPSSTPNETADTTGTPFTSGGGYAVSAVPLLAGFDVTTPEATYNLSQYPGEPTVVVAGDNVIDGPQSSAESDATDTPSRMLAGMLDRDGAAGSLYAAGGGPGGGYGITDADIQSNMVLQDGDTAGGIPGGQSLLARVDRDILAEPDVGTVILDEGLQDILATDGAPGEVTNLTDAYQVIQQQLAGFGVGQVIFGDLTPCGGFTDAADSQQCDAQAETARLKVNQDVDGLSGIREADFSGAVAAAGDASPADLAPADDAGDHVNLTLADGGGYAALATAVSGSFCPFKPPASAPPST
jgi:hypothetical protein